MACVEVAAIAQSGIGLRQLPNLKVCQLALLVLCLVASRPKRVGTDLYKRLAGILKLCE